MCLMVKLSIYICVRTSCESKGLIPDFISMFASTKYLRQARRLHTEGGKEREREGERGREREGEVG